MPTETIVTPPTVKAESKAIVLGRFSGAFSPFQTSCFYDLKAAGLDTRTAHKVAFDYGSDIGNAIKNGDDSIASKIGKAKKNGDTRISITGGGLVRTSRTMSLYRVVQQFDGLYREGLLKSREVEVSELTKTLQEYVAECEEWAKDKEFVN